MTTESRDTRPRSFRIGHRPFATTSEMGAPEPEPLPAYALRLSVDPETQTVRRRARMRVTVHNGSRTAVIVNLSGNDPDQAVSFRFRPESFTVPPGHDATVALHVRAPGLRRGEVHRQLTLHAHGGPVPLMTWATIVQRPLLPAWLARGFGILLALAGAAGLGVAGLLEWTKHPTASGFEWSHDRIAERALSVDLPNRIEVGNVVLPSEATSIGALAALFGLLVLSGVVLRKARMIAGSALAAVIALTGFVLALMREASDVMPNVGFWLAVGAAAAALFGAVMSRR